LETATGAERAKLEKDSIEAQRKYEDAANRYRDEYQQASDAMIKQIHSDLSQELKRLADERGLDVIHAHPIHPARDLQDERWTEMTRIEHLLRSQAMVPIYLRDGVDLTAELVERLNARYDREDK
jgi:Skp family chaperone for outer membrane proteins